MGLLPLLCGRERVAGSRGYSLSAHWRAARTRCWPRLPSRGLRVNNGYVLLLEAARGRCICTRDAPKGAWGPPGGSYRHPGCGEPATEGPFLHPGCGKGRLGASWRVLPSSRVRGTGLRGPISAPGIWSGHSRALSGRRGRIAGATVGGTSAMTPPICAFDGSAGRRRSPWRSYEPAWCIAAAVPALVGGAIGGGRQPSTGTSRRID